MSLKTIELKNTRIKIILFAIGAIGIIFFTFAFKWCFGNALASRAESLQIAELGVGFAPNDPQAHYVLAVLNDKNFLPEDWRKAVAEYEKAVALSPNDYRLWFQLAKARERDGDAPGAEKALRKSLELAPNYSEIQWTLGNLLLRQGNAAEGFNLMRTAAGGNEKFVVPAISTAWQIFGGDLSQVKQNIGSSPEINAALASFLIGQKRYEEAFEAWNSIPAEQRTGNLRPRGEEIYNQLVLAGKFRAALLIRAEMEDGESRKYEIGKITNAGFEINEKQEKPSIFDWQIGEGVQPLIGVDSETVHGGSLSRRIIFNSPNGADFRSVSQTVAVESDKTYEFSMFYRSDLKTAGTLRWEIVSVADGQILAATKPLEAKSDWANLSAEFTPESTEAVVIRLMRVACGAPICPISGSVWFDDFGLSVK